MTIQKLLAIVAIAVATILWHGTPLPAAEPPIEPLSLWYDEPASKWIEALPVGQGRIGAMVFGGIKNERIQFNEDTVWQGAPHDYANTGWAGLTSVAT